MDYEPYKAIFQMKGRLLDITFEEFKKRLTDSMMGEFGRILRDGDIIGHDGARPLYLWIANGMYSINTDPIEILWTHHESRTPEDILEYVDTYPNLFYRYSIVGNLFDLEPDDWGDLTITTIWDKK